MAKHAALSLEPRKTPRQARSIATVDAIFQATLQVLLAKGASHLTTTLVAERAGVSVGTMYQYFPNKQALLCALVGQHLEKVADAIEAACSRLSGQAVGSMSDGLVAAFLAAKTDGIESSRALYSVFAEMNMSHLLDKIAQRNQRAIAECLKSAPDACFADIDAVAFAIRITLAGATRAVLERKATSVALARLRTELPVICRAYLTSKAGTSSGKRRRRRAVLDATGS